MVHIGHAYGARRAFCKHLLLRPLNHENPRTALSKFGNAKSTFSSVQCVYIFEALVGEISRPENDLRRKPGTYQHTASIL